MVAWQCFEISGHHCRLLAGSSDHTIINVMASHRARGTSLKLKERSDIPNNYIGNPTTVQQLMHRPGVAG